MDLNIKNYPKALCLLLSISYLEWTVITFSRSDGLSLNSAAVKYESVVFLKILVMSVSKAALTHNENDVSCQECIDDMLKH